MDGESIVLGAIADSVQEVVEMDSTQIESAPHIGTHLRTEFIRGMGKHDGRFVMILDIDKVFSSTELAAVQNLDEAA
jgi:purine-binding chemotaxis protein CheW